eukprot:10537423-Ditylum_brightwellii.AAC.1
MPFTTLPLSVEFDWAANPVTSELVLEGDYSNSELDFLKQKLLEHCKKGHDAVIIGEEVTIKEWKDKIRGRSGLLHLLLANILVTIKLSSVTILKILKHMKIKICMTNRNN